MSQLVDKYLPNTKTRWRRATSSFRPLPRFLIVGTMKGGTTSLHALLSKHPSIGTPVTKKEIRFFDQNYERGIDWYRANFPLSLPLGKDSFFGEASPSYMFYPEAPGRIATHIPDCKLIVLLRCPVERAFSHYWHNVKRKREPLSFEEALSAEEARMSSSSSRSSGNADSVQEGYRHYSYKARGMYLEQLLRLEDRFPASQILVLRSEDFFADQAEVLERVLRFLQLPEWRPSEFGRENTGERGHEMLPETRAYLREYYSAPNSALYKHLKLDFRW